MRRHALAALLLVLPALPAAAQPLETVEVNGSALIGDWKITLPTYGAITFGGAKWGPLKPNYCRFDPEQGGLAAKCFNGAERDATVTLDAMHLHMASGTMMARFYIDANLTTPASFDGHVGVKLTGFAIESPDLLHGEKLVLSDSAAGAGGNAVFLKQLLAGIASGRDDQAIAAQSPQVHLPDASVLRTLGNVEAAIFLGRMGKWAPPASKEPSQPDFFQVYDVEFANGHRLCQLHQNQDGQVDAFLCI
jgi:hypothetical protein